MYTVYEVFTHVKNNISITMDQQLFREIENTRGREKLSTFIEHLIITGLKTYKKEENAASAHKPPAALLVPAVLTHDKQ
jgi:metal-responsive CopG/Arc/MetJ family transcriptional regulator